MKELTEKHTFRISETQKATLIKLKVHKVNVDQFIRDAIREKIHRDWPTIREANKRCILPFNLR